MTETETKTAIEIDKERERYTQLLQCYSAHEPSNNEERERHSKWLYRHGCPLANHDLTRATSE